MEKPTAKPEELAEALNHMCVKFAHGFIPDIEQRAGKAWGLVLGQVQQVTLTKEVLILTYWATAKALGSDRRVLDILHGTVSANWETFLKEFGTPDQDIARGVKDLNDAVLVRYQKYYDAWDDAPGTTQAILAGTMLDYLFFVGKPDKRTLNAMMAFLVVAYVYRVMKAALDLRQSAHVLY